MKLLKELSDVVADSKIRCCEKGPCLLRIVVFVSFVLERFIKSLDVNLM